MSAATDKRQVASGSRGFAGRRGEILLLSFAVVVTSFVTLLEYNSLGADEAEESQLLEELAQDLELLPALEQEQLIASLPVKEELPPTTQLHLVDEEVDELQVLDDLAAETDSAAEEADDAAPEVADVPTPVAEEVMAMADVEELPEFPGGMAYFIKWLTKNVGYPQAARDARVSGQMTVTFIVGADGSTSDIQILHSFDKRMDNAVLAVLNRMPQWKPGKDRGQPCRTMMAVPLVFQLR